jgi:DNA-binding response OmpR family regulator
MSSDRKKRILVVEDDTVLAEILRDNLGFHGFDVQWVSDGSLALSRARSFAPDLIILDVNLPGASGFDLCPTLNEGGRVPIVMLTARSQKADTLQGFNLGVDDYITKPFDLDELLARVRSVLRRMRPTIEVLVLGDLRIDFVSRTAFRKRRAVHLTYREFDILQYLSARPGHLVRRNELLRALWGYQDAPFTRSVDNVISRLRKKIEPDVDHPRFIHAVYGDGYILTPDGRRAPS